MTTGTEKTNEKIRNLRILKGYSQAYLAMQLRISQQHYSKLERGDAAVSIERLEAIAQVLDVCASQLVQPQQSSSQEHGIWKRINELEHELNRVKLQLESLSKR